MLSFRSLLCFCFISKGRLLYTLNLIKGSPQMMSAGKDMDADVMGDHLTSNKTSRGEMTSRSLYLSLHVICQPTPILYKILTEVELGGNSNYA